MLLLKGDSLPPKGAEDSGSPRDATVRLLDVIVSPQLAAASRPNDRGTGERLLLCSSPEQPPAMLASWTRSD
jgi:hypothetical protein